MSDFEQNVTFLRSVENGCWVFLIMVDSSEVYAITVIQLQPYPFSDFLRFPLPKSVRQAKTQINQYLYLHMEDPA